MLYSAKYIKKNSFKSSAREDATFHSTSISHTQIGGKLENILNILNIPKKSAQRMFYIRFSCMYVRPLKETTTHLSMFPNKNMPCSQENEVIQERSRDLPNVVDKNDCFLLCFV